MIFTWSSHQTLITIVKIIIRFGFIWGNTPSRWIRNMHFISKWRWRSTITSLLWILEIHIFIVSFKLMKLYLTWVFHHWIIILILSKHCRITNILEIFCEFIIKIFIVSRQIILLILILCSSAVMWEWSDTSLIIRTENRNRRIQFTSQFELIRLIIIQLCIRTDLTKCLAMQRLVIIRIYTFL